jgi:hypothetical protein
MFPSKLAKHDERLGQAVAKATVDPKVDKGEDIANRLQKDAKSGVFLVICLCDLSWQYHHCC